MSQYLSPSNWHTDDVPDILHFFLVLCIVILYYMWYTSFFRRPAKRKWCETDKRLDSTLQLTRIRTKFVFLTFLSERALSYMNIARPFTLSLGR
jgi:hypothetical protein